MTESLTVLRTVPTPAGAPRYATKAWVWSDALGEWRKISYKAGTNFTLEEVPVAGIDDVARALEVVRRDPCAMIVRGEPLAAQREANAAKAGHRIRRKKKGAAATLAETSRRWLMIDVDKYPLRGVSDLAADPEEAIEGAIRDLLPECFHDARCFWQLSSSAGFVPGLLKVHLFFWLSDPISHDDLKPYLEAFAPGVDRMLYNAAQPHFVADPIIQGAADLFPRRTGWIKALEDEVVLPPADLAAARGKVRAKRERAAAGAGLDASAARTLEGALALLGDDEGRDGWHGPLRRATWLYACQTRPKERDDGAVMEACRAAVRAAVEREAHRHHLASDVERLCSDAYLGELIEGAFRRVGDKSDTPQGTAPHHAAPGEDVGTARDALAEQIAGVMRDARTWNVAQAAALEVVDANRKARERWQRKRRAAGWRDGEGPDAPEPAEVPAVPPARHAGFAVDVGVGKSHAGREAVVEFVVAQKAAALPHRVLWLGPTTKLNAEGEQLFRRVAEPAGVSVAIHRGREQMDPEEPDEAMCRDLEAVRLAISAGESPDKAVCGGGLTRDGEEKPRCPLFDLCGYQRQKAAVAAADVVIAAHEIAFHELPGKLGKPGALALAVFDESWWQDGLRMGVTVPVDGLAESAIAFPVLKHVPGNRQVPDDDATNDLHQSRARLQRVLAEAPEGYVGRAGLVAAGISAAECGAARKHELNRQVDGLMHPGMSVEARREAAERAGVNAQLRRFSAMWGVLAGLLDSGAEATGRAEMVWRADRREEPRWCISLNTVAPLVDAVAVVPVLLLDATMPAELVRAYLPRLEAAEPVRVKAPHMTVRQVRGGWGKTTLLPGGLRIEAGDDGTPAGTLPRAWGELRDFVAGQTRGKRSLVVTYQDGEAAFGGLPGVEVGHFNAVAGRDEWRDVRNLFTIGRPRPASHVVRQIAATLTGEPVAVSESHVETRGVRMADGTGATIEVRAYAHPAAEAVSQAITDAEVVQAIGRARGVNRTADDPVRVWIMADVALPLVVDELADWRDLAPSAVERMACRGVFLANSADASRAYPDLFPTPEAARKAYQRAELAKPEVRDILLRRYLLGDCPEPLPLGFRYRPEGQGQRTQRGWARPDADRGDLWEWLRGVVGEMALFAFDGDEEPPRSASPAASAGP